MIENTFQSIFKGKVAIVGIGNPLRGDDGAGIVLLEKLRESLKSSENTQLEFLDCGTTPENYVGKISRGDFDTIIILDAADLGLEWGQMKMIEMKELANAGFSTHTLSPKVVMEYLKKTKDANIMMLGIQPKSCEFGEGLSREVEISIERFVRSLTSER